MVLYWSLSLVFLFFDLKPNSPIARFKTQQGKNEPVDMSKVKQTARCVLFNQAVVSTGWQLLMFPLMSWRGCSLEVPLPTFQYFLCEIVCFLLLEELGFYYIHRLFHTPSLYRLHKQHHEWTAPVAMTAIYCHP